MVGRYIGRKDAVSNMLITIPFNLIKGSGGTLISKCLKISRIHV